MPIFGFIFGNSIEVMYCNYLALMILPVMVALFIESVYNGKYKYLFRGIQIISIINFLICIGLQMYGMYNLKKLLITTHTITIILIAILVGTYCYERFILRNKFFILENKFLRFSSVWVVVTAIIDIARYYFNHFGDSSFFIRIGLFVFLIAMFSSINNASTEIEAIVKEAERYEKLAFTDLMTGLYNRAAYEEAINDIEQRINANRNSSVGIVLYDVNDLKLVNDSKGHKAGDFYLKTFATFLRSVYGNNGKCYRIGGDEFVVLCEGNEIKKHEISKKHLNNKIKRYNEKSELKMSAAQGFAVFDSSIDEKFDDTVKRADEAMYANKKEMKAGRDIR